MGEEVGRIVDVVSLGWMVQSQAGLEREEVLEVGLGREDEGEEVLDELQGPSELESDLRLLGKGGVVVDSQFDGLERVEGHELVGESAPEEEVESLGCAHQGCLDGVGVLGDSSEARLGGACGRETRGLVGDVKQQADGVFSGLWTLAEADPDGVWEDVEEALEGLLGGRQGAVEAEQVVVLLLVNHAVVVDEVQLVHDAHVEPGLPVYHHHEQQPLGRDLHRLDHQALRVDILRYPPYHAPPLITVAFAPMRFLIQVLHHAQLPLLLDLSQVVQVDLVPETVPSLLPQPHHLVEPVARFRFSPIQSPLVLPLL